MNPFHGRHFQGEIILWGVRWYCKYCISYRELQEMLAERCVNVDHTTIYRWVKCYIIEIEKNVFKKWTFLLGNNKECYKPFKVSVYRVEKLRKLSLNKEL